MTSIRLSGANGGVGYGVALRLIRQLSSPHQSDLSATSPRRSPSPDATSPFATPNGLTLVLLCRNMKKAEKAKKALLEEVGLSRAAAGPLLNGGEEISSDEDDDEEVSRQLLASPSEPELSPDRYRARFLSNLEIHLVPLDLASTSSTLTCASTISNSFPYLTHLILNAGGGPFVSLNWPLAVFSILTRWVRATTYPTFLNEERGRVSDDGLGWTWQTNLFSHYLLARSLLPLFYAAPSPRAGRIIWTGSLEGLPQNCDPDDWQSLDPQKYGLLGRGIGSYHSVKYQMNLAAWGFNAYIRDHEASLASPKKGRKKGARNVGEEQRVYSYACQPGIVAGLMFVCVKRCHAARRSMLIGRSTHSELIGRFLDFFMQLAFYISRSVFGSPNHVISPYKSAVAFTFVCLSPISTLLALSFSLGSDVRGGKWVDEPAADRSEGRVRFGSCADRWGREYVAVESFEPDSSDGPVTRIPAAEVPLNADGDEKEGTDGRDAWIGVDAFGNRLESGRTREAKVRRLMDYLDRTAEAVLKVHGQNGASK